MTGGRREPRVPTPPVGPAARLPGDADYVVLASRASLDLDGGFAVAVAGRLRQLRAAGAPDAALLTLDAAPPAEHERQRAQYARRGLIPQGVRIRNLFDELAADPSWLFDAAEPGLADPDAQYRDVAGTDGALLVSLPVVHDAAWHLSPAPVVVHAPGGDRVVRGFRGLYRAWLDHVAAGLRHTPSGSDPARRLVVLCESRQIGELLADWRDPRVRIVHTVHNSHLPEPYDDPGAAPVPAWARWLAVLDRFDAVLWPTRRQRDDVAERYGDPGTFHVVPNPVDLGAPPPDPATRLPATVVMVNRLAAQKRVDRAVLAWEQVHRAVPDAVLDVYGDGPLRDGLRRLIDERGLADTVRLRGRTDTRDRLYDHATLLLVSTAFEGQGLAVAEALARGLPVVSFDVRYGPREAIDGGGVLVAPGDVDALARAVIGLLRDPGRRAALSARARVAARAVSPDAVLPAFVDALTAALDHPSRRG